jgi:hypothetical protein
MGAETVPKYFFGVISVMLGLAASLEFVLSYEYKDQCPGHDISTAPTVAGACLLGSFALNAVWLMARKNKSKTSIRAALFAWTAAMTIGVAAAGAALGQSLLLDDLCVGPMGQTSLDTDINIVLLQYSAIALLVLSVAAPHALKKKGADVDSAASAKPLLNGDSSLKKPLVFL